MSLFFGFDTQAAWALRKHEEVLTEIAKQPRKGPHATPVSKGKKFYRFNFSV